ncbi:hypothetical protein K1T71_001646 [Dendrolimus kikuchii]|uniref:Uncharacterized protein n=1 Tax=Dendrolimus kikuchii TaxID=765133 RepID=A0ACC1DF92_9NEOP|nr:hypothetical protein K1T71_001646 [Dendrolimus kikuchii]
MRASIQIIANIQFKGKIICYLRLTACNPLRAPLLIGFSGWCEQTLSSCRHDITLVDALVLGDNAALTLCGRPAIPSSASIRRTTHHSTTGNRTSTIRKTGSSYVLHENSIIYSYTCQHYRNNSKR